MKNKEQLPFIFGIQADHSDRCMEKVPYGTPTDVILGGFQWEEGWMVELSYANLGCAVLIESVALPVGVAFVQLEVGGIVVDENEVKAEGPNLMLPHVLPMSASERLVCSARITQRMQRRALIGTVIGKKINHDPSESAVAQEAAISRALDDIANALSSRFLHQYCQSFPGPIDDDRFAMELLMFRRLQRT